MISDIYDCSIYVCFSKSFSSFNIDIVIFDYNSFFGIFYVFFNLICLIMFMYK